MTPSRPVVAVLAVTLALSLGGCGEGSLRLRTPAPAATVTAPPATPLASIVLRGGRCVHGECREQVVVTYGGSWTYARDGGDPVQGTLDDDRLRSLTRAVRDTALATAPPFTGICPTASDGREVLVRWSPAPSADDVEVTSCERVLPPEDPLLLALEDVLDTSRRGS